MLLDNLSTPALTLLLSLSFIALLILYEIYQKYTMPVLVKESAILSSTPSNLVGPNQIIDSASSPGSQPDISVFSYLLCRALGNRDSQHVRDPSTSPTPPSVTRPPPQTRSPQKRGSRGRARPRNPKPIPPLLKEPRPEQPPQPAALPRAKQPYDAFLVFDVEATCVQGQDFNWCNEIIEFPVVLLRWADKTPDGRASTLVRVDEFHTFVRPTFRPRLSSFCTELTGISQADVDAAPTFAEMIPQLRDWLAKHNLICPRSGRKLQRFMWCTDGPFDLRDFVVKQCFISNIKMPQWLRLDVMDVRRVVTNVAISREPASQEALANSSPIPGAQRPQHLKRPSLNITSQLSVLSLPPFEGRQHSGIDDSRNISRIVTELARIGLSLESNLHIDPGRRWYWMGARPGEIWEEYL